MSKRTLLLVLSLFVSTAIMAQVIITVAGTGIAGYSGDGGPATTARISNPWAVFKDLKGNLYIADEFNWRIRKVTPDGIISTFCGSGTFGYTGDSGLAIYAEIGRPFDFVMDLAGNFYFSDVANSCIRKIDTSGVITTIAGTGVAGFNGDGALAVNAQLHGPAGIAFDKKGNLYIDDLLNYRIRKIDTGGIINTIAGTGIAGFSPDGSKADTSMLYSRINMKIDKYGNLYFEDNYRIRRLDTSGILTTVAGNGIPGYSGDSILAIEAEIGPSAIASDNSGNLFFADDNSNTIRKVADGIITTIAGNATLGSGYGGDGGDPLLAKLYGPSGIDIDTAGNIYIGDAGNNRVREITLDSPSKVNSVVGSIAHLSITPNPNQGSFIVQLSAPITEKITIRITDVLGVLVQETKSVTNATININTSLPPGIYFIHAITPSQQCTQKIIIL